MITHYLSYLLIRSITMPSLLLSHSQIHRIGAKLGSLLFYLIPKLRKRALSNLAIATSLNLSNEAIKKHAIESVQNLVITCLEYPKLARNDAIKTVATCENPEIAQTILDSGKGVIYFCGHQANWEILFLDGSSRHAGTAIGRPVKNPFLYKWLVGIRERLGGQIITPKSALKESLRALKRGHFVGIVGDQGMPDSGFSSPFFGRTAWTSPLPALLAMRTGCPIIVATTTRKNGKYLIHYADPIWPNREASSQTEVPRLMHATLDHLQTSIEQNIGQWLWTHNRWKQQLPGTLKRKFRHDTIGIILPVDPSSLARCLTSLKTFRSLYPKEVLTLFAPQSSLETLPLIDGAEVKTYRSLKDLFETDYLHKLIFNFSGDARLKRHYLRLSAFGVYSLNDLKKIAGTQDHDPLSKTLELALRSHAR